VLLFVEDRLATIQDLDAVKAYDLASTVDPPPTIGIEQLGNLCSLTRDCLTSRCQSGGFGRGSSGSSNRRRFCEIKFCDEDAFDIKAGRGQKLSPHPVAVRWSRLCWWCPDSPP
jgi:hypothetical protein